MKKGSLNLLNCINENINVVEYLEFMRNVKAKMEHPEWLGDFTKEDIEEMLNTGTKIWIYYDKDIPVCSMMFIPATEKSLSKMDITEYDYKEVGDYGPVFVNFDYLGNGYQLQMLQVLDEYLKSVDYKYAASTIHPDNIYSINNFIKDDFKCISQKEFKRGIRNIYFKELDK